MGLEPHEAGPITHRARPPRQPPRNTSHRLLRVAIFGLHWRYPVTPKVPFDQLSIEQQADYSASIAVLLRFVLVLPPHGRHALYA